MSGTFFSGCMVGALITTVAAFILNQINNERKNVGKHRKPQTVITTTSKTPEEVIQAHRAAVFNIFLWIVLVIILVSIPLAFISVVG